jgi:ketosteroid isomerase-like protein
MDYQALTPSKRVSGFSTGSAAIASTVARRGLNHWAWSAHTHGVFSPKEIEMKKLMFVLIASAVCSAFTINASAQQADQATSDAIIALVKAQWASEIKDPTSVTEQMKDASDDYTEFNGQYATRLDGKAMNSRLGEASGKASGKTTAAEMANPKVQVYNGNTAILTYNYVGVTQDKDGKTEATRAKSTRVFVKKGDKWVMVHANFGSDPLPKQ